MQSKQPRKTRRDKGRIQMRRRDLNTLPWIGEQGATRLDQVQALLSREAGRGAKEEGWIGESATRLVVNRWELAGLVKRKKFLVEEPGWIWLTTRALHELELPFKQYVPSLGTLGHLFAVNEVRLLLEEEWPNGKWKSERRLRSELAYAKENSLHHSPDAEFTTEDGTAAIEVEISPKKPFELQNILRELAERYYQVWYYVTDETRNAVISAKQRLDIHLAERIIVLNCPGMDDTE